MSGRDRSVEIVLRRGLLAVAACAALLAVLAGLARLDLFLGPGPLRAGSHGPLFVLGVFALVIGLERAVALARSWAYSAPLLAGMAALAIGFDLAWAPWLACAAACALLAVNVTIVRKQPADFTWLMLLAALVLLLGVARWAFGGPVFLVAPAWTTFLVLTIAAERLEMARLHNIPMRARQAMITLSVALAGAAAVHAAGEPRAAAVFGICAAGLGAWQLEFDIARRTVRMPGLPRYVATAVLAGSAWLVVGGVTYALRLVPPAGRIYDAALHATLAGYVLSMVFAHAPIILPAVARISFPYHRVMYAPLGLLHVGLFVRVTADFMNWPAVRQWGGTLNALTLVAFVLAAFAARRLARGEA